MTAALDAVRKGEADFALVPIENSVEGVVARTLDELASGDPLTIAGEVTLPVTFAFMTKPGATTINRIGTHPHAESQCRSYIAAKYPHAEIVPTNSTSAAAEAVSKGELDAAIASSAAASHFDLEIREDNIGDNAGACYSIHLRSEARLGSRTNRARSHLDGCLYRYRSRWCFAGDPPGILPSMM